MAEKDALLSFILFFKLHFHAIADVHAQRERHRVRAARDLRRVFFQRVDLGIGIGDLDLPLEVHFNGLGRLRIELHGRIIHRHDIKGLHRGIRRTDRQRLRNFALDREPGRKLLQIRLFLVIHPDNAPAALGEFRGTAVEVDVIAGLMPRPTRFRHHQVIPLGNTDMDGVLAVRIGRITLRPERMTGQRPGHRLVHERMQQPEHHRVSRVRTQQRRIGISMDLAVERLRDIRVCRQPLGDRTGPEVQAAARGVRPAI